MLGDVRDLSPEHRARPQFPETLHAVRAHCRDPLVAELTIVHTDPAVVPEKNEIGAPVAIRVRYQFTEDQRQVGHESHDQYDRACLGVTPEIGQ